MATLNPTKNQHYVSQAEQRLNSFNPDADRSERRIYYFGLEDREQLLLRLDDIAGTRTGDTLSGIDLFTLDTIGDLRVNLESVFQRYEQDVARFTQELLAAVGSRMNANLKAPLLGVFAAKLMNFFRNPYSVEKVINTVGQAADNHLTEPSYRPRYEALLRGNRPRQASICAAFDIPGLLYERWLKALLLLLPPTTPGKPSVLDYITKELFEQHYVLVHVHHYTDAHANFVLLSDRGYTIPLEDTNAWMAFDFNLSSSAFVRFIFVDVGAHTPSWASADLVALAGQALRGHVDVRYVTNDLHALKRYNTNTVYQCAKGVLSARSTPWHQ